MCARDRRRSDDFPALHRGLHEIGTGSGYQAAILAEIVSEVFTVEVREPLARRAEAILRRLGYENVRVRCRDGSKGWPEEAPFDGIMVTAAADRVPEALLSER